MNLDAKALGLKVIGWSVAGLAVAVLVKHLLHKGPDTTTLPPEAPAPPKDALVAAWITPQMSSKVSIPYFDLPIIGRREVAIAFSLRNRGETAISFRPQVRQRYGGDYAASENAFVSNAWLEPVELAPGATRIVEGTVPFEGEATVFGQAVYATVHGNVIPYGEEKPRDRDLATVVYFT